MLEILTRNSVVALVAVGIAAAGYRFGERVSSGDVVRCEAEFAAFKAKTQTLAQVSSSAAAIQAHQSSINAERINRATVNSRASLRAHYAWLRVDAGKGFDPGSGAMSARGSSSSGIAEAAAQSRSCSAELETLKEAAAEDALHILLIQEWDAGR